VELILHEAGGSGADIGRTLQAPALQRLPFGFRLGASGEVLTDTPSVQPTGNAKNNLPGGIREF
jgi:hypothetical protein